MVGRRCVPFGGGRWGCENRGVKIGGFRYQTTVCVRLVAGVVVGVARCFVEGMVLLAAAVGWRMSSWFGLVYNIICLILPLLCLTELLPPFISQTLRDGTPQVQMCCTNSYCNGTSI